MSTNEYIKNVHDKKWKPFNKRLWQRNYGVYPERSRRKHIIRYPREDGNSWIPAYAGMTWGFK